MTITWQNVAAPDLTDVSRMLGQGVAGTANAFSGIANAFDPIKDAAKKQRDNLIKLNTATELDAINSIQDVNALNDYVTKLNRTGLTDRYGQNNVDVEQILAAAAKAPEALVNRINSVNDFKENQLKLTETPQYRNLYEQINLAKDTNTLNQIGLEAAKLGSQYGVELTGLIQSRKEALTRSDRENKEFTMRYEKAKDEEKDRLIQNESDKYFGNIYNIIPENLTGDEAKAYVYKDLINKSFYINADEKAKTAMLNQFTERFDKGANTAFIDPKVRRNLLEQQDKFNIDNQPTEASIANTQRLSQENENLIRNYETTSEKGNIFDSVNNIASALKGDAIDGWIIDDDVKLKQKNINDISQSIADTVSSVKSDLAEQYSKDSNSDIYKLASQEAQPGTPEFTNAVNNLISKMMPEGVIKSALKETPTVDPSFFGEIEFDQDTLAKQIKIHMNKYKGSLSTRTMLNNRYQEETNKLEKAKKEQNKEANINLIESLRKANQR